jgi:hypothetical protein
MKNNERSARPGYILLLTLLMLAASVMVVTYISTRGSAYLPFMQTMVDREKAKFIVLGGVQVAIAQLSKKAEPKKEAGSPSSPVKPGPQASSAEQNDIQLLTDILPTINRWQQFSLKEEIDGVNADLKICLMCENGKININNLYDFEKKEFVGKEIGKTIAQAIFTRVQEEMGISDLFPAFERFLKGRTTKLVDVTELFTNNDFLPFKRYQFYDPPTQEKNKSQGTKRPFYLTDIFTTHTKKIHIQPWLLSDSLSGILGLKRATAEDAAQRKKIVGDWLKSFKHSSNWGADWNKILKPVYERELQSLPKGIESVFDKVFEPVVFSVLVHGTVGTVTQRIFAILERSKRDKAADAGYEVTIKKIYWL